MEALEIKDLKAIIAGIAGIMTEKRDELIRLDGAMGDGDLGLTMEKAFTTAREEAEKLEEADAGKLLMKIGMTIARAAPSTMGTLVATGFMSGGKAVGGAAALGVKEAAAFFEAFVAGMMQRGKSKPGEKTLVDVFHPAAQALTEAAASGVDMKESFRRCRAAAAEGLIRTRDMVAQHGRVAYYQEQSKGKEDPGAVAAVYILQGFCDYVDSPGMIEAENLVKRYGSFEAVKGVSFTVDQGQVVGLLGPNGAGKTSIMRILTCYHFPTKGTARVESHDVVSQPGRVRRVVGYLPENAPLYDDMKVREYLSFIADARGLGPARRRERTEMVVATCGLAEVFGREIRRLSKGYRQRVGLAQAILHDPAVLVLDEPTSGLDPNQIVEIRSLIRSLGEKKTVILSTHILQEVEALCRRVLIMNAGKLVAQGTPDEIARSLGMDPARTSLEEIFARLTTGGR